MRRLTAFAAFFSAAALALCLAGRPAAAVTDDGEVPPPITAKGWTNGGPYDVHHLEGRVVAILFFTFDTPDFETYVPKFNNIVNAYADQGLVFFGVTKWPELAVADKMSQAEYRWAVASDDETKTWNNWEIRSQPWGFVLNIWGEVAWSGKGLEIGPFLSAIELALKERKTITVKREETSAKFEKVWKAIDKMDFNAAIKPLKLIAASGDEKDRAHAEQLLKEIGAMADQRLARAEHLAKQRRHGKGAKLLSAIARDFDGLEQAKKARETYETWKKDPVGKKELEAWAIYELGRTSEDKRDFKRAFQYYNELVQGVKYRGTQGFIAAQERLELMKKSGHKG